MKITADWQGQTVAILASGPSMSVEIAEHLRGTCKVVAINNQSFDCAPWADVIWSSDGKWWKEYWPRVKDLPGRKLSLALGQPRDGIEYLKLSDTVYDERPEYLSAGGNGGYAALCLAARMGASRVLLFGYDMRLVNGRPRRLDYPPNLNSKPRFKHWIPRFDRLAPELKRRGVDVVNCTPGSALQCFRFGSLDAMRSAA